MAGPISNPFAHAKAAKEARRSHLADETDHDRHILAPIESAVEMHLRAAGGRFDREDVERVARGVVQSLSPSAKTSIRSGGAAGNYLIQAALTQNAAQITGGRPAINPSGAAFDPTRFGGGRAVRGSQFGEDRFQDTSLACDDDGPSGSSARYDKVGSISDYSSPAGQAYMRDYAHSKGVGWAGSNPDLLRLGPSAIDALAQANFKKETFVQLKAAGYVGRDAVAIARFANETGRDANAIGSDAARVTGALPQTEAEAHRRAVRRLMDAPNAAEREEAGRALDDMHKGLSQSRPGMRENIDRLQRSLGRKITDELQTGAERAAESTKADAKIADAIALASEADALLFGSPKPIPGNAVDLPKAGDKAATEPAKAPVKVAVGLPAPGK